MSPNISFSVISHNQDSLVESLVRKILSFHNKNFELIVTFNTAPPTSLLNYLSQESLCKTIINNSKMGFGANHNQAFKISKGDIFVVLNPDIDFNETLILNFIESLSLPDSGVWGPKMLYANSNLQESARKFPTLFSLILRYLKQNKRFDLPLNTLSKPTHVDWISGAFMAFNHETYKKIGGFDESYFMYFEDVAICKTLQRLGKKVIYDPRQTITHDSQQASHKKLKYFLWHLKSAFIFLARR